ncbi:MAG: hypothetical protein CME65_06240 [Halobacteriovoraceae bacterium]|nr:hypothetical protein [Halobacteriovoraceae bacterium]|tara:strand:- start:7707 stop:9203 length:1497 start_codon:yes stop_codon:yes gene_type:complete
MDFSKENYLQNKHHFNLGILTTESRNQKTLKLSNLVEDNLGQAIDLLRSVDDDMFKVLIDRSPEIFKLQMHCQKVLKNQGKIFIVGCGATGRLALSIEKLFREQKKSDQVISFMAGGDYALIKSIEKFEDSFAYGKRQLLELGYDSNRDTLLAITEGGETSFVIGALEEAAKSSQNPCWFLYCNPDSELYNVDRSARVLSNTKIEKLNLTVGAMALTGSTRMQATTIQMIAAGVGVLYDSKSEETFAEQLKDHIDWLRRAEFDFLKELINFEYNCYQRQSLMTYKADPDLAIAILTDTTERSPTFNMTGFEKLGEESLSLVFLSVNSTHEQKSAWSKLLGRAPRCLEWEEFEGQINTDELMRFDISENSLKRRGGEIIEILNDQDSISIKWGSKIQTFDCNGRDLIWRHMLLKIALNIHSTLLMGKLGRFEGNLMTYVRPSNFKLVNRAYRYIQYFLEESKVVVDEEKIIELIFEHQQGRHPESPVVISVLNQLGVFL